MSIKALKIGDTVAVISPSWCGPAEFPHIYEKGIELLKSWGLIIKEYPSTKTKSTPQERAADFNAAIADKSVKAIIPSIGGDDSILVLPHLDVESIRKHPKLIMGFSDSTTFLSYFASLGIPTFYGPSVMAGFSQHEVYPAAIEHVRKILFGEISTYELRQFMVYSSGYPDWGKVENAGKCNDFIDSAGYTFIGSEHLVEGQLFGGCIEVLDWMKNTPYWPKEDGFWSDKILFLETSEDKPTPKQVYYMLRNYGSSGILNQIVALLFGIPRDYSHKEKEELETMILKVANEFGLNIPIVTNLNFGHTDPQYVMPYLAPCFIDGSREVVKILDTQIVK